MVALISLLALAFVFSYFWREAHVLLWAQIGAALLTLVAQMYFCQEVMATSVGVCVSATDALDYAAENVAAITGAFVFISTAGGILRRFLPRL